MSIKYQVIGAVVLLAVGFGLGKYTQPAKIVTKTQVVTQTNDVIHDHVKVVTVTKQLPDGEKDTTTTTTNNSVVDDQSTTKANSSTIVTNSKPQWHVTGLAGLNLSSLSTPVYGVGIERRILGPIFIGAYGKTNSEAGLSLSLEF